MKLLKEFLRVRLPQKPSQIKAGVYTFRREAGGKVTRFHLRVEEDGSGLLLANASVAARLSPTGVFIARARLEGVAHQQVTQTIKEHFSGATETQIESDVRTITRLIGQLSNLEDNYPVFNLDDPAIETPRSLFAPFHAQLRTAHPEKTNPLLEKLWNSGIMHVTFSASNSSSGDDAVGNVERAEDLGMISGVRAGSKWFIQPELFKRLALAGIDYIATPAVSSDPARQDSFCGAGSHAALLQCIEECKKWEVTPVLEVPVLRDNVNELEELLKEYRAKGIKNVLYYAIGDETGQAGLSGVEIIQVASIVEEISHNSDVRYVWLPPVGLSGEVAQILDEGPRSAGDVSIRVEPDGAIYPARGPLISAGNLLSESWSDIWNREAFRKYRTRIESPTHCDICPELEICGADCPADPQGWATGGKA